MRFLKTKNYQPKTNRKAFTLMEILIAASIFAIVMVIATGVLGQSSSFRGKIQAMRDTSEDAKKISDMITRDARGAGYPARLTLTLAGVPTSFDFKSGIIMIEKNATGDVNSLACYGTPCLNSYPSYTLGIGTSGGAVLILADKDNYKIYHYNYANPAYPPSFSMYYKTIPRLNASGAVIALTTSDFTAPDSTFTKINSDNTDIRFSANGFAPDDTSTTKQQPFIRFSLTAETKGYTSKPKNSRAQITIQSAVTARSFAD